MLGIRVSLRRQLIASLVLTALVLPVSAQTYPSQPINVYVAFAAGGIADTLGRLVATKLGERLKQNVVVENRGGAGGNLAAKAVATAVPDGYTILATTSALAVNDSASKNKGYETNDLRPVAFVAFSPDVIAVHPSNPAKDLREFIANSKQKAFNYGSAGVGTGPHIGAEYFFKEVAKANSVHVPFAGGAPAVAAALGNHIDAVVLTLPTVTPQIVGGALRGIGLAGEKRNFAVPNVPTYAEMGYPNVVSGSWVGFFVPAKTPNAVVAKLNAEINQLMKDPDAQAKLKTVGFDPVEKNVSEIDAYFRNDVATWGKMVRSVGLAN
jgi:tripartite-type tricarboxylate transporter receptor subunit TctC